MKNIESQSFEFFKPLFESFNSSQNWSELEIEFNRYLLTKSAVNANTKVLDYWHSMRTTFPLLSINTKEILSISCGSLDAERSFSKFRNVQSCKRTSSKPQSLKMYSVMHFNGDIEDIFLTITSFNLLKIFSIFLKFEI
jgi:hypothetical protein